MKVFSITGGSAMEDTRRHMYQALIGYGLLAVLLGEAGCPASNQCEACLQDCDKNLIPRGQCVESTCKDACKR
jgi:hypothetical protein